MNAPAKKPAWTERVAQNVRRAIRFVNRDVWDLEISAVRGARRSLVRTVRVLYLVARGFRRDECTLHASSLTFMTLLSIVPVLALALSLASAAVDTAELRESAKGMVRKFFETPSMVETLVSPPASVRPRGEAEETAAPPASVRPRGEAEEPAAEAGSASEGVEVAANEAGDGGAPVAEGAADAPTEEPVPAAEPDGGDGVSGDQDGDEGGITVEKLEELVDRGFAIVEKLNFRALGGVGLLVLVWTVIGLLGNIEKSFNHVWGVAKGRTLARKFTDYLSAVIILPFLCAAASSVPIVGAAARRLHRMEGAFGMGSVAATPFFRTLWVIAILTVAFCFLLRFAPNTRVRLLPGLVGGFVAAVGLFFWLKLCLVLQVGVAKNSALFGSFAMVPILLSWVYVSWIIILVASEVSYAAQNADSYELETGWDTPSPRVRMLLATALLRNLSAAVATGDGMLRLGDFTRRHRVSFRLVRTVCKDLCEAGVLAPVEGEQDAFASRIDLSHATVGSIARTLLDAGSSVESLGLGDLASARILGEGIDRLLAATPALDTLPADPVEPRGKPRHEDA